MKILLAQISTASSPIPTASSPIPTATNPGVTFASLVSTIVQLINTTIIPLLFTLAFLFFIAGLARYIFLNPGDEEGREKGKKMMLYGLIGFIVLFCIWGVIALLVTVLANLGGVSATQSSV